MMRSGRKTKRSPKAERTFPPASGIQNHDTPGSPGKLLSKPGFLSRFRSNKSAPQEPPPITSTSPGRITPEQPESRASSERQKSRDNSPKSNASSTYRNLS